MALAGAWKPTRSPVPSWSLSRVGSGRPGAGSCAAAAAGTNLVFEACEGDGGACCERHASGGLLAILVSRGLTGFVLVQEVNPSAWMAVCSSLLPPGAAGGTTSCSWDLPSRTLLPSFSRCVFALTRQWMSVLPVVLAWRLPYASRSATP